MTILVLAAATLFLAWSNGANDDFKDDHVSARPGDRHRLDPPRFGRRSCSATSC